MNNIETIRNIAKYLNLNNIISELNDIELRSNQENIPLILPLVGEFSSGKTTLINALTDSKKLETSTKPTTSTIYEIHFGCDFCCAKIINEDGTTYEINDISELKNERLANAEVVTVFDTSKQVPSSTILVDTPGLSSPNPKHKQTLIDFIPKADGIILTVDINQQITKSLTDFIETIKLSNSPIFLVLTKSDTKSDSDIITAKKYISENCQIPLEQVAVVSASTNYLNELYSLLNNIQKDKNEIIKKVDEQRLKNIVKFLSEHIKELMKATSSEKELDEAIKQSQCELNRIKENIDRLISSTIYDIDIITDAISRKFENILYSRLSAIINGKSNNIDMETISAINTTSSLLMNEYRNNINALLNEKAKCQRDFENEVSLSFFEYMDLSSLQMSNLTYNLNLNEMGHQYDNIIKKGIIAAVAVTTVAVGAGAASAGTASVAGAISTTGTVTKAIDIADTISDIGSIIYHYNNKRKIEMTSKALVLASNSKDEYTKIENKNQDGLLELFISTATDKLISKPQRVRAIREYIEHSLSPEFRNGLNHISQSIITFIHNNLKEEASIVINQKNELLNILKSEINDKKELFKQRTKQLHEFQNILSSI